MTPHLIGPILAAVAIIVLAPAMYFLPSIVAHRRGHNNKTAIVLLNAFLGWTVLGWLGAMVWAVANPPAVAKQ